MPRTKSNVSKKARRKKILKLASGHYGKRSKWYRLAKESVMKALTYAYRDRKKKKSDFRSLWNIRINAALRPVEISYSRFINGLKRSNIVLNRKTLSNLAISDIEAFNSVVAEVKKNIA
ncbi:MAG TPA: 50S ribosomal protein L20 [Spirochaetia bacterium]|nr:50S ribosomal protein L20 [Spirochaetia bacterium]